MRRKNPKYGIRRAALRQYRKDCAVKKTRRKIPKKEMPKAWLN